MFEVWAMDPASPLLTIGEGAILALRPCPYPRRHRSLVETCLAKNVPCRKAMRGAGMSVIKASIATSLVHYLEAVETAQCYKHMND